jgi:hypothetical protein
LGAFVSPENHEDLIVLKDLVEPGKLRPVIDRTDSLGEAPKPGGIWKRGAPGGRFIVAEGTGRGSR